MIQPAKWLYAKQILSSAWAFTLGSFAVKTQIMFSSHVRQKSSWSYMLSGRTCFLVASIDLGNKFKMKSGVILTCV